MKPLCIDLYCGLGGWAEGLLAEGWNVVGFDVERHQYPAQLVIQDVLTLHGRQFRNAALIVASPPCQAYSYRAMPWKRAKALPPPSNELFDACFRIQREASEAAGRYIPMIVENVKGAQSWVGRARWHYGSFYLWGDVPALMPSTRERNDPRDMRKGEGGTWFAIGSPGQTQVNGNPVSKRGGNNHPGKSLDGVKQNGSGPAWFDTGITTFSSRSHARKAASAQIAKIPRELALHIARVFKP